MFLRNSFINLVRYARKELHLIPTGSWVRKEEQIGDLDFLSNGDLSEIVKNWKYPILNVLLGKKLLFFDTKYNNEIININVWKVNKENVIFQKFSHNYPRYLEIAARKAAQKKGFKLNSEGLFNRTTGERVADVNTTEDIFRILDIQYRKPWEKGNSQLKSSKGK